MRSLRVASLVVVSWSPLAAQTPLPGGQTEQQVKGQWQGPFCMQISCVDGTQGCGGPSGCSSAVGCESTDEIGNAALIPAGAYAGKVLVWTRCADWNRHPTAHYQSHVWDPMAPSGVVASLPMIEAMVDSDPGDDPPEGPFCSGQVWMLDDTPQKNPVLLGVGGGRKEPGLNATGSKAVFLFSAMAGAWDGSPTDLDVFNYYPTVFAYPGSGTFLPMVLGGSQRFDESCDPNPNLELFQFKRWFTLARPFASSSWVSHSSTNVYRWQQYPRPFLVKDKGVVAVLTAGHAIACEDPTAGNPYPDPWGGNPSQVIVPATMTHGPATDPNAQFPVGGWNYCNAVILHTLKSYAWNPGATVEQAYDLNRIIVTGGQRETEDPSLPEPHTIPALPYTLELRLDQPANAQWFLKAATPTPRFLGSFVLMPDRRILALGGRNKSCHNDLEFCQGLAFADVPHAFDPMGPSDAGTWTAMARNLPVLDELRIPRGYHSLALLLADGRVALTGGQRIKEPDQVDETLLDEINTADSVEVYQPPYMFANGGPVVTTADPLPEMHYGVEYCLSVNLPTKVDYAVLMGVSSVTHHFDYGQRYVELMIERDPASGCAGSNLKLMAPQEPFMAPEGYYLLFLVNLKADGSRVPSLPGRFVKLTF